MLQQSAKEVLMVRPIRFEFNQQTAETNAFQNATHGISDVSAKAQEEFDAFVALLQNKGIAVKVFQDTEQPATPDSIFPNNWISYDQQNRVCIYPMAAPNRRAEKREDIIGYLQQKKANSETIDLSAYESKSVFLEGTGSMVIDYVNKIAYACLSPRTGKKLFLDYCKKMNYTPCYFTSLDKGGKEIYHTNVMMCIGTGYVVICLESIANKDERADVIANFNTTEHEIISISFDQMNHFAGNMLEVQNAEGEHFLVMSTCAYNSLTEQQKQNLAQYATLLTPHIPTIETIGGGGVRCMMAEVF